MTHDHDTDRHHAQILDWLTAALTDETILKITLEQDQDDAGQWYAQTHHLVDVEWEAAATSRANQKTLAQENRPEWVDQADMDPDPTPYDLGGFPLHRTGATACQCDDCQALEALETLEWETALTEDVEWTTTTHGETITATFTGPRERLTDLLLALYGYAQKEN